MAKGIYICPFCGEPVDEVDNFCSMCGKRLAAEAWPEETGSPEESPIEEKSSPFEPWAANEGGFGESNEEERGSFESWAANGGSFGEKRAEEKNCPFEPWPGEEGNLERTQPGSMDSPVQPRPEETERTIENWAGTQEQPGKDTAGSQMTYTAMFEGRPETSVLGSFNYIAMAQAAGAAADRDGWLQRCSTGEEICMNISPFRLGKKAELVEYQIRENPTISRHHATIIKRDGRYFISDNHSTNGTFVNSQQVFMETELHEGDRVKLSDEEFVFTYL